MSDKYIIGTDCYDEEAYSYCLGKINKKGVVEIIETATIKNKEEFWSIVEKYSKFYNAPINEAVVPKAKTDKIVYGSKVNITPAMKELMKQYFKEYINGNIKLALGEERYNNLIEYYG